MNRAGFDALYREHYPRVLGLCRRMLGDAYDAEDAAQEVFMRGYRAFDRYRSEDPFGAWIGAIGTNHCIDLLRQRRRLAGVFDTSAPEADPPDPADAAENGVGTLISAYEARLVTRAVDGLPERYRLPIVLAYYTDASYHDIAAMLGVTANHVGVLLLRGKQRLRRELATFDQES